MKLFVCTDHEGHFPVGVASLVVAHTEFQARELLRQALAQRGLTNEQPFTLVEVAFNRPHALILKDGNY